MVGARNKARMIVVFILHQLISPYLLLVISGFLTFSAMSLVPTLEPSIAVRTAHWILTETPYFPVQILIALITGFVVGKRSILAFARWMWVIPSLGLMGAFIFVPIAAGQSRIDHFFGWGGLPQHRQYDELAVTLPFYVALAYSLAASLGTRLADVAPSKSIAASL
jgi:hypothetical protein